MLIGSWLYGRTRAVQARIPLTGAIAPARTLSWRLCMARNESCVGQSRRRTMRTEAGSWKETAPTALVGGTIQPTTVQTEPHHVGEYTYSSDGMEGLEHLPPLQVGGCARSTTGRWTTGPTPQMNLSSASQYRGARSKV